MKYAIYMRVSTEDQKKENQNLRLHEVAEIRGYDIVGIYTDKESGGPDQPKPAGFVRDRGKPRIQ